MWGRGLVILAGPGKSLSLWNFKPRQSEVVLCVRKETSSKDSRGWRGSISVGSRPGVRKTCSSGLFSFPCFDRDKHARNMSLSSSLWFQKNNNKKKQPSSNLHSALRRMGGGRTLRLENPCRARTSRPFSGGVVGSDVLIFQFFKRNWKYRFKKYKVFCQHLKKC